MYFCKIPILSTSMIKWYERKDLASKHTYKKNGPREVTDIWEVVDKVILRENEFQIKHLLIDIMRNQMVSFHIRVKLNSKTTLF